MKASAQKDPPHDTELVEAIERAKNADTWVSYKNAGNCAFQKKCYLAAVRMYTKALSLLETAQDVETENGERNQVVSQVLSNRSAAYVASPMHAGPSLGLKDAQACVESNRSWYKGYTRVAEAYFAQKKYKEAQGAYEKALEVARQHMCQDDRPTKLMGDSLLQNLEQNVATCIARQKPITEGNERSNQEEAHDWKHRKGPTSRDEIPKTEYEKPWELDSLEGIRAVRAERNDASETHYDERSARKKFNADISEADRVAAQRYKDQLLESFRCNRKSVPAHSDEDTLRSAYPRNAQVTSAACLKNPYEAYTLPTFAHLDKDTFPKDYSHGTDYLGKVITNEALSQKVGGSWGG